MCKPYQHYVAAVKGSGSNTWVSVIQVTPLRHPFQSQNSNVASSSTAVQLQQLADANMLTAPVTSECSFVTEWRQFITSTLICWKYVILTSRVLSICAASFIIINESAHVYCPRVFHAPEIPPLAEKPAIYIQCESAYWPALAVVNAAQLAAAHYSNERTLDFLPRDAL